MTSSPYFDNICTLPLQTDLFACALHPTQPVLTIGLASGHVQTYRLPFAEDDSTTTIQQSSTENSNGTNGILSQKRRSSTSSENGLGSIDTIWATRRHKGSCRAITYSLDGTACYSGGTDGLIKAFNPETGKVTSKIAIPPSTIGKTDIDAPTVLHVLTPLHLLVATDSGTVHFYSLKEEGQIIAETPSKTLRPHGEEHVNELVPIPPTSESTSGYPKQFITVGGSTLAVTDLRKGIMATSEDQEIELSSVAILEGLKSGGTSVGSKVLVGQSDGVLSLFERGAWSDLDERIVVDREGASIDALCEVPQGFLPKLGKLKMSEKIVAVGLDDGRIRFVRIGRNAVLYDWDLKHDEVEGVTSIHFDENGTRMITGGGQVVKVWTKASAAAEAVLTMNGSKKRPYELDRGNEDEDGDEDEGTDDDEDELNLEEDSDNESEERGGKRRKRKRNKGKDKSGGRALTLSGFS